MIQIIPSSTSKSLAAAFHPSLDNPAVALCTGVRNQKPNPGSTQQRGLYPTPPPLLPQPSEKKRIRPKKPVSTYRNKELTTSATQRLIIF
jgi:hypothetical protein